MPVFAIIGGNHKPSRLRQKAPEKDLTNMLLEFPSLLLHPTAAKPREILWFWKAPKSPGDHWGWELETYPVITEVHFTDAERTRAAVKVTIGYSGCTVELEQEDDRWIPRRLTNKWIT